VDKLGIITLSPLVDNFFLPAQPAFINFATILLFSRNDVVLFLWIILGKNDI